ncbi:FAD-dependent monooxygenase [Roseomonas sp. BN140053]|uniref:FAD-dependent monooxygenase n=1 Tax=Roseomonas sp. BN140053 TaxID=3391898 RepID=UPI0039E7C23E
MRFRHRATVMREVAAKPMVLVAGAGIGGLVAALALQRRGFPVTVLEQASALRELGAGVQIAANGSRVLCTLGLRAEMESIATVPDGKVVRLFNTGQSWPFINVRTGTAVANTAPYWMVHRGDFHRVLVQALEARSPGAIRLGQRCIGVEQDGDGVTVLTAGGGRFHGAALIGADGVHSRIREALFGGSEARFTGFVAWRGLIPMDRVPERLREAGSSNWIGPHGHVVTYPLRGGALLNLVAAVERDDWRVESWSERGTTAEIQADFALWHPDVQAIVREIDEPYKWALLGRAPMPRWSVGRVTLLGDACHPTLPFLAQGANMAIEDGMVLARALDAFPDVPEALRRYEEARRDRTAGIVRAADDNASRFHNPDLARPEIAPGFVAREFDPGTIRRRYDWIYTYDAAQVAL